MPEYRVVWSIDVIADDHRHAAEVAEERYIGTDGARVYEVTEWQPLDIGNGATLPGSTVPQDGAVTVDLDESTVGEG